MSERRRRVERIADMIRRVAESGYTGSLTFNFRGGSPTSVKRESHHGPDDDWSFGPEAGEAREALLRSVRGTDD